MNDNRRHIVLNIDEGVSDLDAMTYVASVISMGKTNGENKDQYRRLTHFAGSRISVKSTHTRAGSDKFHVKLLQKPAVMKKEKANADETEEVRVPGES